MKAIVVTPSTWADRRGRERTPSIPGHELAGVVSALGYGTTGLAGIGIASATCEIVGLPSLHVDGARRSGLAREQRGD